MEYLAIAILLVTGLLVGTIWYAKDQPMYSRREWIATRFGAGVVVVGFVLSAALSVWILLEKGWGF